jgi:glutamine amidotransferase-like uncharacterized protein
MRALGTNYRYKIFTRHNLELDFFDDVDMVCFPGGIGDSDSWDWLMREHRTRVRNFVRRGGAYLGICMGAYWADSDYFDILDGVRVQQYIRRPGACSRRPHAKHMPITWRGKPDHMYFYDGCSYAVSSTVDVVARYSNGDPMAIMQGRIGLIGCHPEAEHHWYQDYSWMRKRWAGTRYHYLREFVDELGSRT